MPPSQAADSTLFRPKNPTPYLLHPGALDIGQFEQRMLFDKIQRSIEQKQKVTIFLDFDDTMIFINRVDATPSKLCSSYVNQHLIKFLATLFSRFGTEAFKLEILSARLADQYMKPCDEHAKIQRLLPLFLNELAKQLPDFAIEPHQIKCHCLMKHRLHIFKKHFKQTVDGIEQNVEKVLTQGFIFHEQESSERINKTLEAHIKTLKSFNPDSQIFPLCADLTKANYLFHILDVKKEHARQEKPLFIHIDDNEYENQKIRALNCVHVIRVTPQSRQNALQVPIINHPSLIIPTPLKQQSSTLPRVDQKPTPLAMSEFSLLTKASMANSTSPKTVLFKEKSNLPVKNPLTDLSVRKSTPLPSVVNNFNLDL